MSQPPDNQPWSRDQILDEIEFLLSLEHALIVEYLSVCCALGYDLDPAHGGPVNETSRQAAAEANNQADLLMLKIRGVVDDLSALRTVTALGRAREITDAAGAAIPLEPPSREQLEHLLEREEAIAAAVDARYARLVSAMYAAEAAGEVFPAGLRTQMEGGTHHVDGLSGLRDFLAGQPIADLLRATRRDAGTDAEKALLQSSDRAYAQILDALGNFYRDLNGELSGDFRVGALVAMDDLKNVNHSLVRAGLLPPFQLPAAEHGRGSVTRA
jgi:hypothetical protein